MLHWLDYAIIGAYLVGILILGFALERKASKGVDSYFLGDRNMPWWALGASGMASNVDISGTMVIVALVYALGAKGFFIEIRGGIVLVMAFFMVFMGKWMRRANVMTMAEWMKLRFGEGVEGRVARLISAVANLVVSVWIISYFAVGGGKFFGMLTGFNDKTATFVMMAITLAYTVASGFYGAVWTDVFQGGMILIAVLYVVFKAFGMPPLPEIFQVSVPLKEGGFTLVNHTFSEWSSIFPSATLNLPGQYSIYNLFGITIFFYLLKTSIEGFGGAGGYTSQRYFAAKSDREAGLLSLFWISLLSFRWPLIASFAVLGIHLGISQGAPIQDPELVLPTVIAHYAPVGMKGLVIACFMAAAMSTFSAIINASGAYWVKDIYQAFINPKATEKTLMRHSRWASFLVVALGVILSFPVVNINDIWGWITMAFGAGLFVPLLLRWYWWRYNGWGFAIGTASGAVGALVARFAGIEIPEYMNFVLPAGAAFVGCVVGTLLTPATNSAVLENFYRVTRPFGFWKPQRLALSASEKVIIDAENKRDFIATLFAVPWQLSLFLVGMTLVMKSWLNFGVLAIVVTALSFGLYHFWFRHLKDETK